MMTIKVMKAYDLGQQHLEYGYVTINLHVSTTITCLLKFVLSSTAHRNLTALLYFEIIQEFLMHSINVYRFSFRQ